MDMQFMPQNQFGPYSDNPQFVKKVFTAKRLFFAAIAIAVMLVASVFGIFYAVSLLSGVKGKFSYTPQDTLLYDAFVSMKIWIFSGISALLLISFIGFMIMSVSSADKTSPTFPKSGIVLNNIFLFAVMFVSAVTILYFCSNVVLPILIPSENKTEYSTESIGSMIFFLAMMIMLLIWSLCGTGFCSSLRKTVSCKGIYSAGAKSFSVTGIILSILNYISSAAVLVIYFYPESPSELSFITDIQSLEITSVILLAVFFAFGGIALDIVSSSVKRFNTAASQARHSIKYNGANYFVSNESQSAEYYQSVYTSPTDDNSNPPQAKL